MLAKARRLSLVRLVQQRVAAVFSEVCSASWGFPKARDKLHGSCGFKRFSARAAAAVVDRSLSDVRGFAASQTALAKHWESDPGTLDAKRGPIASHSGRS